MHTNPPQVPASPAARWFRSRWLVSAFTLLFVLAVLVYVQAFSGGISILSFSKLHLDSLLSRYEVVGLDLQRTIERSLRFGKPLESFLGMEEYLRGVKDHNPDLDNVTVNAPDGRILYSLLPGLEGAHSQAAVPSADTSPGLGRPSSRHVIRDSYHHLLIPIHDRGGEAAGVLDLSFSDELMGQKRTVIIATSLRYLAFSTLAAALVLPGGLWLVLSVPRFRRTGLITIFLLLILGLAQLAYVSSNIALFRSSLTEITRDKVSTVTQLLRQEIENLLAMGVAIDRLINIEAQLERTIGILPEVASIAILDRSMEALYVAGMPEKEATGLFSVAPDENTGLRLPLRDREGVQGHLAVQLSIKELAAKSREVALDSLTILVLSLLFLMEVLFFVSSTLMKYLAPGDESREAPYGLIRPATFFFMFSAALCYSFIPLYAETLYQPLFGFSRDFVLGLPLATEMLCGGLALIPVGIWIDRRGWHEPFLAGIFLCAVGTLLSGVAKGTGELILYRALAGVGYGFSWMAAQGFVLLNTTGSNRARGIAGIVAGIFSGVICGSAVGALLAPRIGYGNVFLFAGGLMLMALVFTLLFLRRSFIRPPAEARNDLFSFVEFRRFILDRQVLLLLGCSLLPYSIAMVGLLYYVSPIYLGRLGVAQADIGRAIMIFGLCMICLAPQVARFADALPGKKALVALGGFLGGGGLLVFHFLEGYPAALLAILLLGISVSISAASRNVLTIELPASKKMGMSKVMGVYRTVDKLGQTLGPVLVGLLLIRFDVPGAMTILGIAWIAVTVLFVTGSRVEPAPAPATGAE